MVSTKIAYHLVTALQRIPNFAKYYRTARYNYCKIICLKSLQCPWNDNKEECPEKIIAKKKYKQAYGAAFIFKVQFIQKSHEPVFFSVNNSILNQGHSDHLLFFSLRECSPGLWPNKSYFSAKYCLSHFPARARLHILNICRREQYLWKVWNLISTPRNRPFPSVVKQND